MAGCGSRRWPRPPAAVWFATALFGLIAALWTVAVPPKRAPDEPAHVDLILYLAEGHGYPGYDQRYFGDALELHTKRYLVDSLPLVADVRHAAAVPRSERPDVDDLGGTWLPMTRRCRPTAAPTTRAVQPDAPAPAAVLRSDGRAARVERSLLPGSGSPASTRRSAC